MASSDYSPACLQGRVTAKSTGRPLAGALVRAAVPHVDLRHWRADPSQPCFETTTDEAGRYRLELPVTEPGMQVALDALCRGYRSSAGTYMRGGDRASVVLDPGGAASFDFALEEALYVAGVVVDERGEPVSSAKVTATMEGDGTSAYVTVVRSDEDGRFEIYDFPVTRHQPERGELVVVTPHHRRAVVADIYPLTDEARRVFRIVLPAGRTIRGRLVDECGEPLADVMVEANFAEEAERRATLTGDDGRFELRGLTDGDCTLVAHAKAARRKAVARVTLDRDIDDLTLRATPAELPAGLQPTVVLGMTLVDVTPELKGVYDLWLHEGALVLDPGADHERLGIEKLVEGDCFWIVGHTELTGSADLPRLLLDNLEERPDGRRVCRVVYTFRRVGFAGTNTQYLRLTEEDLAELERVRGG